MKYLFVFLLLGLVSCGDASSNASENVKPKLNEYTEDEVTYPNGIVYLKKNMKPVTGILRDWHENGQLKTETNCKDGKLNGLARGWYENGQLEYEYNYEEGKFADGLCRNWHKNGQLKAEGTFKGNNRISAKCYDENGNKIICD